MSDDSSSSLSSTSASSNIGESSFSLTSATSDGKHGDDDFETATTTTTSIPKVDIVTILTKDTGDESLERYKRTLIASDAEKITDPLGRQVVIQDMRIQVENRPDIIIPLSTPELVSQIGSTKIIVKEGTPYHIVVNFRVFKDIVLGLKCTNVVKKLGIKVDTIRQMIGSYAPKATEYSYTFPKDEFASGMLARGVYTSTTTFTDDDGTTHLSFSWSFEIRKDWA